MTTTCSPTAAEFPDRPTIRLTRHVEHERLAWYGLTQLDILEALGAQTLRGGRIQCRTPDTMTGDIPPVPRAGDPILIGRQFSIGEPDKSVLLAVNRAGRRLHLVVQENAHHLLVVTLWCPDDPQNTVLWFRHALRPNRVGDREINPTKWCLSEEAANRLASGQALSGGMR